MTTLNSYLHKLAITDKAMIRFAMKNWGDMPDCHNGLLPFIKISRLLPALMLARGQSTHSRAWSDLISKFQAHVIDIAPFTLCLDDKKVYKRFGPHPERGVKIPGMPIVKRTAGVSYNLGAKDYRPHKVVVPHVITLQRVSKNLWVVMATPEIQERVSLYLMDHCSE